MTRLSSKLSGFLAFAWLFQSAVPSTASGPCDHFLPPPITDTPDDAFVDANGDGINGMACGPIFVTPSGDDRNLGTIDAPMQTLGAAILAAKWFSPPRSVYVSGGSGFNETVVFVDGVSVYGGYDHTLAWSRSNAPAPVSGGLVGAWVEGLTIPMTIDRLAITAANNTAPGGLSIGLAARTNTAALNIVRTEIRGGNVAPGTPGINGSAGAAGTGGAPGGVGSCDGAGVRIGGIGGASPVGNPGGKGGDGGIEGNNNGLVGINGQGPAFGIGGSGGHFGDPGQQGSNGQAGGVGANGVNGPAGTAFYAAGATGGIAVDGSGGGGGGGGGGQDCTFCDTGAGNGGGGGGGGGAAGTPGGGGTAGGSSYGILAIGTGVSATNGLILAKSGAAGGTGGVGGTGGAGGASGAGAAICTGEVGRGGTGGLGGKGGNGGHGGGGAGGNSIAVLRESGATFTNSGATLLVGAGGSGGVSAGNTGVNGASSSIVTWGGATPLPNLSAPTATYAFIVTDVNTAATPVTPLVADHAGFTYTFTITSSAAHGTAGVSGNQLTYNPLPAYSGTDSFRFCVTRVGPATFVEGYAVVVVESDCAASPLTIGQHPLPAIIAVAQPAVLSVTVTGTAPLSYQWRKGMVNLANGGTISGADTATLTINPFVLTDAGSYDVIVTDACDTLTSNAAALTACNGPANLDFNCDGNVDGLDIQIYVDRLLE